MKINFSEPFVPNGFFAFKDNNWLENQRVAGKVVAQCLSHLENLVKEKTKLTLKELDAQAEQIILEKNCIPTFKNYKGFPASVCISVNKQLVHGIPTDYVLQEGDVVSFDLGATYKDAIADSAITCIYGEPQNSRHVELVKCTQEALMKGIEAIEVGKQIGAIGHAIHKYAKETGFYLIEKYGGHGISNDRHGNPVPHAFPFIANKSKPDEGVRIYPGMTLAIEPMLVIGGNSTHVDIDNWTVYSSGISAHWEHTVFVHNDHVEIITERK